MELSESKIGVSGSCFSRLEVLFISHCVQLVELSIALPNLKMLTIEKCSHLKKLEVSAPILYKFSILQCEEINDTILLGGLKKCQKVAAVSIKGCPKVFQSDLIQMVPTLLVSPEFSPEFLQLISDILQSEVTTIEILDFGKLVIYFVFIPHSLGAESDHGSYDPLSVSKETGS